MLCLGVNAIVGSGIYVFPGSLAALLGPASFLAFGLCGLVAALIGLCFAEAAGMFERSGGPYVYASAAFGGSVGYLVGWACWAAAILSWAAVARAIPPYLGQLSPLLGRDGVAVLVVVALGAINFLGVKPGALTTDVLTVAKIVPLVVLALAGLGRVHARPRTPFAPLGLRGLPQAAFSAFFAFQGFEVVPVPAGETARPRRNAPLAVLGSLSISTILYMAIQWIGVATTPTLAGAKQPLAEMGVALLGRIGGSLVSVAAAISMIGFCAGVALAGPRYVEALASDARLPRRIADRHPRFGSPHYAILLTTGLSAILVVLLDFAVLADLSVLTVCAQYLATCLAVPVLRQRAADLPRAFRLPLVWPVSLLAVGVTIWLASQARARELGYFGLVLVGGLLAAGATHISCRDRC